MMRSDGPSPPEFQGQSKNLQSSLFPDDEQRAGETRSSISGCQIVPVGKRRDGGTRFWCLRHRADATAKYGKPGNLCRASHIEPIPDQDVFELDMRKYTGGVALWGAVPAVYDTTGLPLDRGVHVHARFTRVSEKEIDQTCRAVRVLNEQLPQEGVVVSEIEAIYYMVSSVFGYHMKYVACSHCNWPHLDKDWFSVHPHRRHLCAGCGKHFSDTEHRVGNPIVGVRRSCGLESHPVTLSLRTLDIKQSDYPGGIQIWGSNPAFLWTSDRPEEEGIHVHAFRESSEEPEEDETYGQVIIDGIRLDPEMVRVLMAQSALPSLKGRVQSINCPSCDEKLFATGESAFTPSSVCICSKCGERVSGNSRLRKIIANPLPAILSRLAKDAPREPQQHDIDLLPETL